jgi:hypothetical protein
VPHLVLAVRVPPPRRLARPSSFFDVGHVDVLLCGQSEAPRWYGFYPSPGTRFRQVLSAFVSQRARMLGGRHPVAGPVRWLSWPLTDQQLARAARFLDGVAAGCESGATRYRALRSNCFHLARRSLEVAGVELGPLPADWVLFLPTLGARSFFRRAGAALGAGAAHASLEAALGGGAQG